MTTPQSRLDLDRVLNSIDAPHALVILTDGQELETATKGIDNDEAIFELCWSICMQLAEQLFAELPAEKQRQARIVLPTSEQAKRLGFLKRQEN